MSSEEHKSVRQFSQEEALLSLLYQEDDGLHTGAWARIYKRELFSKIRYPFGFYYEDLGTTYRVFFKCKNLVLSDKRMYMYRIRQDSIIRQDYSPKMMSVVPVTRQLYHDIAEKYPALEVAAASRAFSANRMVYFSIPYSMREERLKVWEEMCKYRKAIILDPKARKRERIAALLTYLGADLFHVLFSRVYRKQHS